MYDKLLERQAESALDLVQGVILNLRQLVNDLEIEVDKLNKEIDEMNDKLEELEQRL